MMEVSKKLVLEWEYSPIDLFHGDISFGVSNFTIAISDGKVVATADLHDDTPSVEQETMVQDYVSMYFHAEKLRTHLTYALSKMQKHHIDADGRKQSFLMAEAVEMKITGRGILTGIGSDGGIVDPREAESRASAEYRAMVAKHCNSDRTAAACVNFYTQAVDDPDHELMHLEEIREVLRAKFGGEANVRETLGIDKREWSLLGRLVNDMGLAQGKHRGMKVDELRSASADELQTARDITKSFINKYFQYLDAQ